MTLPATPVLAQPDQAMGEKLAARFAAADKDHDGKLTPAEARAGMPVVARYFDQIDSAHAGTITLAQIAAFLQKQRTR